MGWGGYRWRKPAFVLVYDHGEIRFYKCGAIGELSVAFKPYPKLEWDGTIGRWKVEDGRVVCFDGRYMVPMWTEASQQVQRLHDEYLIKVMLGASEDSLLKRFSNRLAGWWDGEGCK